MHKNDIKNIIWGSTLAVLATSSFAEPHIQENFNSYSNGQNPASWVDTEANNGLTQNDNLFSVIDLNGDQVFATSSTQTNIHSHLVSRNIHAFAGYEFTGRMMADNTGAGIGINFFSQYGSEDAYYRLRSYHQNPSFHLSSHGVSVNGNLDSGVVAQANEWYHFRVQVQDAGTHTELRAKVWIENSLEPTEWQVDAIDSSAKRLTSGTIGVWSMAAGNKYWDDFSVTALGDLPNDIAAPSVLGLSVSEAENSLNLAGLKLGEVREEYNNAIPRGQVILQNPGASSSVYEGSSINISVSKGGAPKAAMYEDFETGEVDKHPSAWLSTSSRNGFTEDQSRFKIASVDGNKTLSAGSGEGDNVNIHSHYQNLIEDYSAYEYTGRMRFDNAGAGTGVTFFSQYPNSDHYYRLRRWNGERNFKLSAHGTEISGDIDSGIYGIANQWYQFRIEVIASESRTDIRARIWHENESEPSSWQMNAYDENETRLSSGQIGVWSMPNGLSYWDDLQVSPFVYVSAGNDQKLMAGQAAKLRATTSARGSDVHYQWKQISGSNVPFLDAHGEVTENTNAANIGVYIPASAAGESFSFEVTVTDGTQTGSDIVNIHANACADDVGYVFVECLDPTWQGFGSWEMQIGGWEGHLYYDWTEDNHVSWSVVALDDEHGNVIDVKYNRTDTNASFQIVSADRPYGLGEHVGPEHTVDMGDFWGGKIVFDIRALDIGDNPNPLNFVVECIWPCQSDWIPVDLAPVGEWKTVTINIDDLIYSQNGGSGLVLSQIGTAFQFAPNWDGGDSFHIQLDNIRWEKAYCDQKPGVIFKDCLDPTWNGMGAWDDTFYGSYFDGEAGHHVQWSTVYTGEEGHNYALEVSFNDANTSGNFWIFRFENPGADLSEFSDGDFVMEYKVITPSPIGTSLLTSVSSSYGVSSNDRELNQSSPGVWRELRIPVSQLIAEGVDISAMHTPVVLNPVWGLRQDNIRVQLDNIRFEH